MSFSDVKLTIQIENISKEQSYYVQYALDEAINLIYNNENLKDLPMLIELTSSTTR